MAYEKSTSETRKRRSSNADLNKLYDLSESDNIAADWEKTEEGKTKLANLGKRVCEEFQIDLDSRSEWEKTAEKAMKAARQVSEPKSYPWAGASNVKWPLVTVAALQFNARSYPEIVAPSGVVGAKVKGSDDGVPAVDQNGQPIAIPNPQTGELEPQWQKEPGAKAAKAERVKKYMDNYILRKMDGWERDTDTLLMQLPIIGDVVKKVYPSDKVCASEMISAFDFVVNQKTRSLSKCPRMTHVLRLYPHEIEERIADERFIDFEYDRGSDDGPNDEEAAQEFLEQHRRADLDVGIRVPIIVTVHKKSEKVCRVVVNFEPEAVESNDKRILRIPPAEYFINYIFFPDPEGGFYGVGFGHILKPLSDTIDTTVNQMIDAGTLQNSGGGFIASGVRLKKGVIKRELGVYTTVSATGENLRNAIVPFEDAGPSPVLFQLLGLMLDVSRDITSVKDILTGDSPQGETATTTLARIEQGMKVFTAIYKRVYEAGGRELNLIYKYLAERATELEGDYQTFMDEPNVSMAEDFNLQDYDICPEADPRLVTDQQRMKQAEALMATVQLNPAGAPEILRRFYTAIGATDIDKLLPPQQPDPMQQLQLEGAVAEVEKTKTEGQLNEAKTVETLAGIEQENTRLALEGFKAVGEQQMQDDAASTEKAGMVLDEARAEKDRKSAEIAGDKDREAAAEQAKAKAKQKVAA